MAGDVEPRASAAEKFRVTVNDKILLHLLDYVRYAEKHEAPREVTQQGIAEVLSARRSHISLAVNTLRERGHLEERTMRITDEVRRRKAYFLTPKGYEAAKRLTASFQARTVRVEDASGVRDVPIGKLSEVLGEKYYLVDILCCTSREGILDLAQLTGQQAAPEAPAPAPPPPKVLPRATTTCPFCYVILEVPYEHEGPLAVACSSCGNVFQAIVSAPVPQAAQAPLRAQPSLAPLGLGAGLAVAAALLSLIPIGILIGAGLLIAAAPVLAAAALALKPANPKHRDALVATALVAAAAALAYMNAAFGNRWDAAALGRLALVVLPLYAFTAFATPVPVRVRAEVASALGVFLLALAAVVAVTPWLVGWPTAYAGFFLIAGAGVLFLAVRMQKPASLWVLAALGAGGFILALSGLTLATGWTELSWAWRSALAAWCAVSLLLVTARFARARQPTVLLSVRAAVIAAVGGALTLVGAHMLLIGRGVEGAVEVALGVPLVAYGVLRSGAAWGPRLATVALFLAAVAATWWALVVA